MSENNIWQSNKLNPLVVLHRIPDSSVNVPAFPFKSVSVMCFGSGNSWEPLENLDCEELVAEFEKNVKRRTNNNSPRTHHNHHQKAVRRKTTTSKKRLTPPAGSWASKQIGGNNNNKQIDKSFSSYHGLTAEAILGTTDAATGEVFHLVKWEGKEDLELVPATFTTIRFPHVVIAFYNNRLRYSESVE